MKHVDSQAHAKPPSCKASIVFIGKNRRGQWVAQERNGLYGGLFVNRTSAMRYALFENGDHPEFIITVPTNLELDMSAGSPSNSDPIRDNRSQRQVA